MVRLKLEIRVELENVTDLQPSSDFDYFFKVRCTSCNETHPNFVTLNRTEEQNIGGSKQGTAHLVWRCGHCKQSHYAKFDTSVPVKPYSTSDHFSELLCVECRGLEFIDFDFTRGGTWKCKGTDSGTQFSGFQIEKDGWTDYDEKARLPTMITFQESRWTRA